MSVKDIDETVAEGGYEGLQKLLRSITQYDQTALVSRPQQWGTINFEAAEADVAFVLSLAKDFDTLPTTLLPLDVVEAVIERLRDVAVILSKVDAFSIESGEVVERRDELVRDLRRATGALQSEVLLWLPYLEYKDRAASDASARLREVIREAEREAQAFHRTLAEHDAEAGRVVRAIQGAAGEAGVAAYTVEFDGEALDTDRRAKRWLWVTGIGAFLTACVTLYGLLIPEQPDSGKAWALAPFILSKLSVVVVFVAGTVWCGRIYRALLHQRTTNRHRALSLKTFQTFVEATTDERTKDAILLAAANNIFANVSTGLADQVPVNDQGVQIVELGKSMRRVSPTGAGDGG